jgi:FtsP/CotA-like multicopper oxidase with cupredoxin domain
MQEMNRRALLRAGGAVGVGLLAGCTSPSRSGGSPAPSASAAPGFVGPHDASVLAAEAARRQPGGRPAGVRLMAGPGPVDLGGRVVQTWSYGGQVPGPEIRVRPGDTLTAVLDNQLPQQTTVHWHGLELYYPMDGSPSITQPPVAAGSTFTYRFTVPDTPGTYWFHPHVGVQQDHGLYGAFVIEDPREPLSYDHDWTVVLDDWIDGVPIGGVTATPDKVLATLRQGMSGMSGGMTSASPSPSMGMSGTGMPTTPSPSMSGMSGMSGMGMDMGATPTAGPTMSPMAGRTSPAAGAGGSPGMTVPGVMLSGATSPLLGGDAGDVRYPFYLACGRMASAPRTLTARPGDRVRIRLINAGGDTAFRVALGGHRLQVVHADGNPVQPVGTDAVLLGMAERYDVIVTLGDGVFPLVAWAEGKNASALAVVRTGPGRAPVPGVRPAELRGHVLDYAQLQPADRVRLARRPVDRVIRMSLDGGMARYNWSIDGRAYQDGDIGYAVREGERVRLVYTNTTTMWHPMHLHGHAFALRDGTGPRKDTVNVMPGQTVTVQFDAKNPGRWMTHCHNVYHETAGMMAAVGYLA